MRWLRTLCVFTLLAGGAVVPASPAELDQGWSRPRRASSTRVVKPQHGSLPRDEQEWAMSAVPLQRDHYLFSPEWMAEARAESYVSGDIQQASVLGRDVAASFSPLASRAPLRRSSFDGLKRTTSTYLGGSGFPPDASVSAGPDKIIQVTNVAIRMTTRGGVEIDRRALNFFFGFPSTDSLFDPKTYFDRLSGRFFVVALEQDEGSQRSGIWLAISKSSDPSELSAPSDFCTYRINSKVGGSWADYPSIGINENWFAISVNNFRFGSGLFRKAYVYVMPVAQIINNASGCPPLGRKRFNVRFDADNLPAFTIQPAQHYTANNLPGNPLFMVSASVFLPSPDYTVWRITTGATGRPVLSKQKVVGDFSFHVPPAAPQKGGGEDLDAGDMRVTQAAFRDGKLWAVHGTACGVGPLPNESCIRAVEFSPNDNGAPITFSETFGRQNHFLFWPGVAINQVGDVAVAFQRSRPNAFLDIAYNGKRSTANRFDAVRPLRLGTCVLDNFDDGLGLNRTGDYLGMQTDPLDNLSFWIAGEYPGSQGGGLGCDWKTRVGRAKY